MNRLNKTFLIITITVVTEIALIGKSAFFGDPPDNHHPWAVHDHNRPLPPVVTPAANIAQPPSDAIVLFDGTEASFHDNWRHNRPADERDQDWIVVEGALQSMRGAGKLSSIAELGDFQLHIEWRAPTEIVGQGQGRGNSGVFFMGGMVEVQILDNYKNPTYADGSAGAVYGLMPPAVNALRPSGEWQSYDIIFRRPIARDGVILDYGSLTVLLNGVVVQDNTPLEGGSGHKKRKPLDRIFPEFGALMLQDHGNPVRFRNIWYRPLRPRSLDGGSDGRLPEKSTLAKRSEIAEELRQHARTLEGQQKALRLLESLKYEEDTGARVEADNLIALYVAKLKKIAPLEIENEKNQVLSLDEALQYMHRHRLISNDYPMRSFINDLAIQQGWKEDK
ncbi:MAG: DUF1080 domain-containing protein [Verrucomicrobiota bacterium]|nr:DUF1080 domain-containing protein [Verrucomicrobiota bacterium]MEC7235223.1 DUF1080 domain-containing protein [Verrucomicrobiota bacterium]